MNRMLRFFSMVLMTVFLLAGLLANEADKKVTPTNKILVVYYSRTGNTERVAKDLASRLGADSEKIIDTNKRTGFFGFMTSGKESVQKTPAHIRPMKSDFSAYDLVLIGTPVWAGDISSPVRAMLMEHKGSFKDIAVFATSGGDDPKNVLKTIEELAQRTAKAFVDFSRKDLQDKTAYESKIKLFISQIRE